MYAFFTPATAPELLLLLHPCSRRTMNKNARPFGLYSFFDIANDIIYHYSLRNRIDNNELFGHSCRWSIRILAWRTFRSHLGASVGHQLQGLTGIETGETLNPRWSTSSSNGVFTATFSVMGHMPRQTAMSLLKKFRWPTVSWMKWPWPATCGQRPINLFSTGQTSWLSAG